MKHKFLLLAILSLIVIGANAQQRSVFRSGYMRLGINKLGNDLNSSLSPKANIFDGRYGAGTGYVFEFGHAYYFKNKEKAKGINFGLDWTILSLTYNQMDKWAAYAAASRISAANIGGQKIAASISSKLGPVLSVNPVEKLVIDFRFQVAPTARFFDFKYSEATAANQGRSFTFVNNSGDDDGDAVQNRIAFGVATNFGVTLRRGAIGLSLDYQTGKVNSNYEAYDTNGNETYGKAKIQANSLQAKLSFTL
jgi:hypothetical protein